MGAARLKLRLLQKIATAPVGEVERFLLANCVETYLQLTGSEAERYAALRRAETTPEVEAMETTWEEKLEAKFMQRGLEQGLRQGLERSRNTLLRQIRRRFGSVSAAVEKRIEAIDSHDQLDLLADRIFEASSLEELGLGS